MSKRSGKKARERLENEVRLKAKITRLTPQNNNIEVLPDLDILKGVEDGKFTGATMITFKAQRQQTEFFGQMTNEQIADLNKLRDENKRPNSNDFNNFLIQESHKMVCQVSQLDNSKKGFVYFRINPKISREVIHYLIDMHLNNSAKLEPQKHKGRFRGEQIQALQVWEERRLRKPFNQIAKELGIKEPAAKKAFYKAYELIYGKKYDPADYEKPEIKKEYLKKFCNTCMEKSTCNCKVPCPDVVKFVDQDSKTSNREHTLDKPDYYQFVSDQEMLRNSGRDTGKMKYAIKKASCEDGCPECDTPLVERYCSKCKMYIPR